MQNIIGLVAVVGGIALAMANGSAQSVEVQRVVSPGGVEAWLVEDHLAPIISSNWGPSAGAETAIAAPLIKVSSVRKSLVQPPASRTRRKPA